MSRGRAQETPLPQLLGVHQEAQWISEVETLAPSSSDALDFLVLIAITLRLEALEDLI